MITITINENCENLTELMAALEKGFKVIKSGYGKKISHPDFTITLTDDLAELYDQYVKEKELLTKKYNSLQHILDSIIPANITFTPTDMYKIQEEINETFNKIFNIKLILDIIERTKN